MIDDQPQASLAEEAVSATHLLINAFRHGTLIADLTTLWLLKTLQFPF